MRREKDTKSNIYVLRNENLSCAVAVESDRVELLHFGVPITFDDAKAMKVKQGPGWGTSVIKRGVCLDAMPLAWSGSGMGDYRESPLEVCINNLPVACDFEVKEVISSQKYPRIDNYPFAKGNCSSLEIVLRRKEMEIHLCMCLFEKALVRWTYLVNTSDEIITVRKIMSQMTDLKGEYAMTTLDGGWITEAHEYSTKVGYSRVVNESLTGFSSNRHNPGFLLTGDNGAYAFNLIYSGNHYSSAQLSQQNFTRVMQGINYDNFACPVKPGETFCTPQAVMTYSPDGVNAVRKLMHGFVNDCIVPEYWRYRERPVLYNNWEGTMFDYNESKLLSLAAKAKKIGCEMFVLDDGWFGQRNSDTAGLGDYNVNLSKLPSGIDGLSKKIHAMGMKFGLWFEPEAVNPDSDLYRAHPDWAIHTGSEDLLCRNELLLDLRKKEVRDYIVKNVSSVIDSAELDYIKWDMNRHSTLLGNDAHEYIMGLYDVLRRIFSKRPHVLLESCASGGNRFDLGIMCYSPQAWASDDTDPIERLDIQEGLYNIYPQSVIGSHISASPHIQTLRATPLSTRENVSMFGIMGLELDLSKLSPVDVSDLKETISFYKKHRYTFQFGQLSVLKAEKNATAWQVSTDKETIVGIFHRLVHAAQGYEWLHAEGLEENQVYSIESRPQLLRVNMFAGMVKYLVPFDPKPDNLLVRTADKLYRMSDATFTTSCSGNALRAGVPLNLKFLGTGYEPTFRNQGDFSSNIYVISKKR